MKKNLFVIGLFSLTVLAACDSDRRTAQGEGYQDTVPEGRATEAVHQDHTQSAAGGDAQEFVTEAASGSMMEVELGRIAQEKATNQEVKNFAAMMVKDHSQANEQLKSVLQNKNMQAPQQMTEDHRKEVDRFRDMQAGQDFDKEYVDLMVEDHEEDIEKFESAQNDVQDPEIRQWIESTLPTLRQHKQHIDKINDTMDNNRS
jgi:putative membrane protein